MIANGITNAPVLLLSTVGRIECVCVAKAKRDKRWDVGEETRVAVHTTQPLATD